MCKDQPSFRRHLKSKGSNLIRLKGSWADMLSERAQHVLMHGESGFLPDMMIYDRLAVTYDWQGMYFDHRRSPSDSDHTPLTRAPREGQGPSNSICQHQMDISPIFDQTNAILYRSKSYDTCFSYIIVYTCLVQKCH